MTNIIEYRRHSAKTYSDGDIEAIVLNRLQSGESAQEILFSERAWPVLYHLSPQRHNLLSWYSFVPGSSLLEVGAGWGALTGLFINSGLSVTAVELSMTRSEIIAARFPRAPLDIVAANIHDVALEPRFDYATLIGVLEYAAQFGGGENPYLELLRKVNSGLKCGGTLFLAIENPFGIKYWAGADEDHCGVRYASIEGYRKESAARTFTQDALTNLLIEAGFSDIEVYYAMPDYKLPERIVRADCPQYFSLCALKSRSFASDEYRAFNETSALKNLATSGHFGLFANSFLIISKKI